MRHLTKIFSVLLACFIVLSCASLPVYATEIPNPAPPPKCEEHIDLDGNRYCDVCGEKMPPTLVGDGDNEDTVDGTVIRLPRDDHYSVVGPPVDEGEIVPTGDFEDTNSSRALMLFIGLGLGAVVLNKTIIKKSKTN